MFFLLFAATSMESNSSEIAIIFPNHSRMYEISYDTHPSIIITSDAYFADNASAEEWEGDGSEAHPYIIEGYNISTDGICIKIQDTTVHYIIQNCFLTYDNSQGAGDYAMTIIDSPNGTIANCTFNQKGGRAINLINSDD